MRLNLWKIFGLCCALGLMVGISQFSREQDKQPPPETESIIDICQPVAEKDAEGFYSVEAIVAKEHIYVFYFEGPVEHSKFATYHKESTSQNTIIKAADYTKQERFLEHLASGRLQRYYLGLSPQSGY